MSLQQKLTSKFPINHLECEEFGPNQFCVSAVFRLESTWTLTQFEAKMQQSFVHTVFLWF